MRNIKMLLYVFIILLVLIELTYIYTIFIDDQTIQLHTAVSLRYMSSRYVLFTLSGVVTATKVMLLLLTFQEFQNKKGNWIYITVSYLTVIIYISIHFIGNGINHFSSTYLSFLGAFNVYFIGNDLLRLNVLFLVIVLIEYSYILVHKFLSSKKKI